jgi:hypothetical protein
MILYFHTKNISSDDFTKIAIIEGINILANLWSLNLMTVAEKENFNLIARMINNNCKIIKLEEYVKSQLEKAQVFSSIFSQTGLPTLIIMKTYNYMIKYPDLIPDHQKWEIIHQSITDH